METKKTPVLAIVVPCFNEEAVLPTTANRLQDIIDELIESGMAGFESHIIFVDDGSVDATWGHIHKLHENNPGRCKGLKLSRNYGHQNALWAGLMAAKDQADCVISLDADMQDDPAVIPNMLTRYTDGNEIVYAVRKQRVNDSIFKRRTARGFYWLMRIMGVGIIPDHADYRLASKRALDGLREFTEVNLFLRGIFPIIGFKTATVFYDRHERLAGQSKYPLKKMLAFAIDAISSFSTVPLKIITWVGFLVFILSGAMIIEALVSTLIYHRVVRGWASTVLPIYFLGGIQLLSLGIIGEYIGKIYKEVKRRPRYIVESELL